MAINCWLTARKCHRKLATIEAGMPFYVPIQRIYSIIYGIIYGINIFYSAIYWVIFLASTFTPYDNAKFETVNVELRNHRIVELGHHEFDRLIRHLEIG